jgi:hypothetical protein
MTEMDKMTENMGEENIQNICTSKDYGEKEIIVSQGAI